MERFLIVLQTKAAGMPYNIRIETSAETDKRAQNNALFLLRKYGQDIFNVNKRAFSPHLLAYLDRVKANREDAIKMVASDTDEMWNRAVNLRDYVPSRESM